MDNAGPHNDFELQSFLTEEFNKRKWLLVPQPSNSPITNVKDDCFFPALSKQVSTEQGVTNGSVNFTMDELWKAVHKCYWEFSKDTLGRAHMRHSQIVSAIAECKGTDAFVRESSRLHCGVRKCCVAVCDNNGNPYGVEVVTAYDDEENEKPMLRYKRPIIQNNEVMENLDHMKRSELECVIKNIREDGGSCDVMHDWIIDSLDAPDGVQELDGNDKEDEQNESDEGDQSRIPHRNYF